MSRMAPSTPSRLAAYTDAVFAVIITIMVLELRPPAEPTWAGFLDLWPTVVSYVVSYAFVAIIWMNHHYLMTYITTPSLKLLWLNFGHLFCVSFLPFATAWLAESELAQVPVIFYAVLFVATDGMYNLFEAEILKHAAEFSAESYRAARRRSLFAFLLFVVAVGLAIVDNWLGFGFICLALALHLRPDATPLRRRKRRRNDADS
ncbi:TMEM175 family protein [Humibacter sp.]|uniref:TMEM175 family protein n=1 Tax=Humibacter sp. TaxID=1940291 RepID=UPI002CFFA56E|nr:TMEM175 family protein [Humibacter sp.]HVX07663.1 TMEM175 family protein [Humibacter sp.]